MDSHVKYTAAVITVSDKGFRRERVDTAGPACEVILQREGWEVVYKSIVPDDIDAIVSKLIICADEKNIDLIVTTGGTGFSKRDVTPEATLVACSREVRGIPEAMRAESLKVTKMGMLSRAAAGIRGESLVVNVPGSEKAAGECLSAVVGPMRHGVQVLRGDSKDCGATVKGGSYGLY